MTDEQKKIEQFLEKLRPLTPVDGRKEIEVALQILDAAKTMHPQYTIEELYDFVFYGEVPKRKISPERRTHRLWNNVWEHYIAHTPDSETLSNLLVKFFDSKSNL